MSANWEESSFYSWAYGGAYVWKTSRIRGLERSWSLAGLYAGEVLVCVGDLACSAEFAAHEGEDSWQPWWRGRPVLTEAEAPGTDVEARRALGARFD